MGELRFMSDPLADAIIPIPVRIVSHRHPRRGRLKDGVLLVDKDTFVKMRTAPTKVTQRKLGLTLAPEDWTRDE